MRLRDFQIVFSGGRDIDRERELNSKAFPVYEAVRLWLKDAPLSAL